MLEVTTLYQTMKKIPLKGLRK